MALTILEDDALKPYIDKLEPPADGGAAAAGGDAMEVRTERLLALPGDTFSSLSAVKQWRRSFTANPSHHSHCALLLQAEGAGAGAAAQPPAEGQPEPMEG